LSSFDTRHVNYGMLTETLMNTVAAHKLTLMMAGHSIIMLSFRSLMILSQRRLSNIKGYLIEDNNQNATSV
jgi:hypothetical protein